MLRILFSFLILLSLNSEAWADVDKNAHQYIKPLKRVDPRYPIDAARDGVEGSVILMYSINELGRTNDIIIVDSSGHKGLDKSAIKALKKWRYEKQGKGNNLVVPNAMLTLEFMISDTPDVREEISTLFSETQVLIENNDALAAREKVKALKKFDNLTRKEALMYWSVMASYYDINNELPNHYFALTKFHKFLTLGTKKLDKEQKEWIETRLFVAAVNSNNYEKVFAAYKKMQESDNAYVQKFEALHNEMKEEFSSMTEYVLKMTLNEDAQVLSLRDSNFSVQVNKGAINSLELRCDQRILELPKGTLEHKMDAGLTNCKLLLQGKKGSQLAITQTI